MSNFTKSYTINVNFEGDNITLLMSRMKRKDALKLIPFISDPTEADGVKLDFKDQLTMMNVAADFLPKYIKEIKNFKDAEGNELTVEDLTSEAYFLELLGDILKALMEKSFMSKSDVKKLDVPQEKSSGDTQDTQHSELKE